MFWFQLGKKTKTKQKPTQDCQCKAHHYNCIVHELALISQQAKLLILQLRFQNVKVFKTTPQLNTFSPCQWDG
jgi:hypothetical protein